MGLAARDIIPLWLALILPARDLFLWGLVPILRTRGYSALPVHFLGKAATAALLYAFPLLLLGDGETLAADAAKVFGWAFAIWGVGMYWWAGLLYAWQVRTLVVTTPVGARRRLVSTPRDPSGRPLPPQVTMGLLNYVTTHSLDEDYEVVAAQRQAAAGRGRTEPATAGPGRRSPSRHLLALLGLLVFGLLVGVAAQQAARSEPVGEASRDSLIEQVRELRQELADTRTRTADLRADLEAGRSEALQASTRGRELSERLDELGASAGSVALTGPGVRIEVDDGPTDVADPQVVLDTDLQILVNGLWSSGAEAVAINGQRLTALSAIRIAGDAITVNFRSLARPYVVSAIGDPDDLAARFVESEGGTWWLNLKSIYDLTFEMTAEDSLTVPAAPDFSLRHARPTGDAAVSPR